MWKIKGVVQHYSWGGQDFIPHLLGITNEAKKPYAEYWLGAHPNHPSGIEGKDQNLLQFISATPEALGGQVRQQFESFPYLLKVLDVAQMLSIQVHPPKEEAEKGFDKEHRKGIAVTAPHRNYKDRNHKPEAMVALSDFWLLHGFKPKEELKKVLRKVPELNTLLPVFEKGGYRALYEKVMSMPEAEVGQMLQPLLDRIVPLYQAGKLEKTSEDFWGARAALHFCKEGIDRGIFSIYFFNLLHLERGQGIFQPARMPHAYLEGQNVEIMANSDNVLRAGLTDKHIDVAELLKHVDFTATHPRVILPAKGPVTEYGTPAEEFELFVWQGTGEGEWTATGPEIILVLNGGAILQNDTEKMELEKGEAVFVAAGEKIRLASNQEGQVFRAAVPAHKK